MNYKVRIFTLLALLYSALPAEAQSGFDVLVQAKNGLLPRPVKKAKVFFYNRAGERIDAALRTDNTGRTRLDAYWFKPGDTIKVGVEPVSKKEKFCKNNEKIYRLKSEKIIVIPAEFSTVAIRLKRKFNPLYDLTDIATASLIVTSAGAKIYSQYLKKQHFPRYLLDAKLLYYQKANRWNHVAVATFYSAIAVQSTRWLLLCPCKCLRRDPARKSRVNLMLKPEILDGIAGGTSIGLVCRF